MNFADDYFMCNLKVLIYCFFLVSTFHIHNSFSLEIGDKAPEITSIDISEKSVLLQKIDQILKNTWNHNQAKEFYRPEYERGLLQWKAYQNSKSIKERLVKMAPVLAYDFLMTELRNEPNLNNFLFYEPFVYSIKAGNVLALRKHFSEIMDYVKDSERLLEYVLGLLKSESPSPIRSEILNLQIEIARRLYFVSETRNESSKRILKASGIQSVCFDGQCFPVSDLTSNQCNSFLLSNK